MQTKSVGGSRYLITFIDDYSRYCFSYFMKQKLEPLFKFVPYFVVSSCSSVSNESELLSFDVKLSPASLWDMGVDSAAKDSKVT